MPVTPFRAMEFKKNDVVTKDAMDQMQANLQYIRDNTPRGRYYLASGESLDVKTVIVGGKVRVRKSGTMTHGAAKVRFGKTFDPSCRPHVTTSIIAEGQRDIYCVISGPDSVRYPDASGFEVTVTTASDTPNKVIRGFWISWQAFGFRSEDMNAF